MKNKACSILMVEDDLSFQDILKTALSQEFEVEVTSTRGEALKKIKESTYDLILIDLGLPDGDGLELMPLIKENCSNASVVVVTMSKDIRRAIQAVREGAYDYVTKDLGLDEILRVVHKVVSMRSKDQEIVSLRRELSENQKNLMFCEVSPTMQEIMHSVFLVAPLPTTVLILGETGTGKELLAREIHKASKNPSSPFVSVNLAAVHKELMESVLFGHEKGSFTGAHTHRVGKFELVLSGTLFLDEIGCVPLDIQTKLLRVIQEKEFERLGGNKMIPLRARFIFATHRDLSLEVQKGTFREDLYYRLKVYPIQMPPLRDRLEQLPYLANYFFRKYLIEFGKPLVKIHREVWSALEKYPWHGNVRELENLMERLAVMNCGQDITVEDLPAELRLDEAYSDFSLPKKLDQHEKELILKALQKFQGHQRGAAAYLQIPLSTLKFKLRRYGISSSIVTKNRISVVSSV